MSTLLLVSFPRPQEYSIIFSPRSRRWLPSHLPPLYIHGILHKNNILIFILMKEEHGMHMREVSMQLLTKKLLINNLKKCLFMEEEWVYLGFVISQDVINMDPNKVKTIVESILSLAKTKYSYPYIILILILILNYPNLYFIFLILFIKPIFQLNFPTPLIFNIIFIFINYFLLNFFFLFTSLCHSPNGHLPILIYKYKSQPSPFHHLSF